MHQNEIKYFKKLQKGKKFKHHDLFLVFNLIDLKMKKRK
jgi:hypothetical protein